MSTVSRGLPAHPHLDVPKQQARELLRQCKAKSADAIDRIRRQHPRLKKITDDEIAARFKLSGSQLVIAREYGFSSWTQLKERITGNTAAHRWLRWLGAEFNEPDGDLRTFVINRSA